MPGNVPPVADEREGLLAQTQAARDAQEFDPTWAEAAITLRLLNAEFAWNR